MASPANHNPPPGTQPFDKFFNPTPTPTPTPTPIPTPTFNHPYYTASEHPHRSLSFPTPPLQPPPPPPPHTQYQTPPGMTATTNNPNAGARLMALLSAPASVLEAPGGGSGSEYSIAQTTSAGSDFVLPKNMVVGGAGAGGNLGVSQNIGGAGGNLGNSHTSSSGGNLQNISGGVGGNLGILQNIGGSGAGIGGNLGISHTTSGGSDFVMGKNMGGGGGGGNLGISHSGPVRMTSSKMPRGRHLRGGNSVYDVDVRLPGEVQPQLEVSPITKYGSDPGLVLGRQIAVNKTYICYGLKLGAIRVLNINTALRSLLKGLAQRVTDMAFFAEDVHLLAGSSVDGRVYVWKLTEGPDEEDKPQITGSVVIAVQIVGEWKSVHPRVCWHFHKQEVLVVGIGKYVLKIDTTKIGKGKKYSAEEPLVCPISKLIDGVQLVGEHDGEVTDLSMCQWMTTRLVSASVDGTIKIWEDRKLQPIAVLRPHDGQPVSSVTFLAAADRPDHIILITGGPLNREIKIWSSASEEGWLLPSDAESWTCNQTLELKSSTTRAEDSFFNQVVALPQTGLFLLANAKKNAIYAVHLDYGPYPAATRMDYIAEFTVTMPILSFTGTSSLLHGEHIVQVYCVQTQAIQQYALDLSQCLPPPLENAAIEKSDSSVSFQVSNVEGLPNVESPRNKATELSLPISAPKSVAPDSFTEGSPSGRYPLSSLPKEPPTPQEVASSSAEFKPVSLPGISTSGISDSASVELPALPLSPRLSAKLSGYRTASNTFESVASLSDNSVEQAVLENSVDRQPEPLQVNLPHGASSDDDSTKEGSKSSRDDISTNLNSPLKFKHPTHLVTPSEILMASSPSEANHTVDHKNEGEPSIKDVVINTDSRNVEVEVKVVGGEKRFDQNNADSHDKLQSFVSNNRERSFYSQASDIGIEMTRESRALPHETSAVEEPAQYEATSRTETSAQSPSIQDEVHESVKEDSETAVESVIPVSTQQLPIPSTKGRKQKVKNDKGSGPASPSRSAFNSADSSFEPGISSTIPSTETTSSQIIVMQETLNQLMAMQKDMQKQLSVAVTTPVTKEGRRLEAAIGRNMEKALRVNSDAMWARFQEEISRQEKLARENAQQITNLVSNCISKDFPAVLEKAIKKELTAVGQVVARTVVPTVEKTISTTITEAFQKGVSEKAVNQLEKSVYSKLEATVARQIQLQFQTSGKQALQESLKSSLEASVIPAFEMSCRALFEQVETTFQKGMAEHTAASQQKFESTHSPLALTLREAINSASSLTQTLSSDLSEGHRKLLASLSVAGATPNTGHPLVRKLSNGPLPGLHEQIEAPVDPTKELSRMVAEHKFEEAFTTALQRSDVYIVSWLCSQVDLQGILALNPLPLSQGVLLSLAQQLACDISNDTPRKLGWMRDVLSAVNPTDPMIVVHIRPIFEQVYQILNHHRSLPTTTPGEISNIRLLMHVINSMLMTK